MPKEDKEREEEEFNELLGIFSRFMSSKATDDDKELFVEELMSLRARHLLGYAFDGFGMTFEEAIYLLQNPKNLSELDAAKRDIILAAVQNLVDFAVAEEYQMLSELPEEQEVIPKKQKNRDEDEDDDFDSDEDDEYEKEDEDLSEIVLAIFARYNKRYAVVENKDVTYAMIVAAYLVGIKSETMLTYMTMGDERVRPWHLQYEGFTARKSDFPAWLIPPIEHMCRCYLITDTVENSVQAAAQGKLEMPDWFNPTFKESVALGGRIFSDEHRYFQIKEEHFKKLKSISEKILKQYIND